MFIPIRSAAAIVAALPSFVMAQHGPADPEPGQPVFFDNLGSHHRVVTTSVNGTQGCFDAGLRWYYAFNVEEAERDFRWGLRLDPGCAMCYWGAALSLGPGIDRPADPARQRAANYAAQQAVRVSRPGVEQDMATALLARYPADDAGRGAADQAYADAMRALAAKYPDDADIQTLFAESLIALHASDLWNADRTTGAGTEEIVSILERVLASHPDHPGANYNLVHVLEGSPRPEKALAAAERLGWIMRGSGALIQKPAALYMRLGRYEDACNACRHAIAADHAYLSRLEKEDQPAPVLYMPSVANAYRCLAAAAMAEGRADEAIHAGRDLGFQADADALRQRHDLDGLPALPILAECRFGRWDAVLAERDLPTPLARALRSYARGLALAAKGQPAEARKELEALSAAAEATPADAPAFRSSARGVLQVAHDVLAGELALAEGSPERAIEDLRRAVQSEDALSRALPPDWYAPARTALGAALLRAGRAADAEAVYREDLARNPETGWSLIGLAQALKAQGKDAAEAEQRFKKAWANADTPLTSSWF
jgi:tetratricopeptide (TPR) repeat protein